MPKESILKMLQTLCDYNNVAITHTFGFDDQPMVIVKCVKDTKEIQITYLEHNSIKLFTNLEDAAKEIKLILDTPVTTETSI